MRRLLPLLPVLLAVGLGAIALTAANTVPDTDAGSSTQAVGGTDVRPPECEGMTLGNRIVSNNGVVSGTLGNDLIIGGTAGQTIDGLSGNDCIHGGGGDDTIVGGSGTDVAIGGDGVDTCDAEQRYQC